MKWTDIKDQEIPNGRKRRRNFGADFCSEKMETIWQWNHIFKMSRGQISLNSMPI